VIQKSISFNGKKKAILPSCAVKGSFKGQTIGLLGGSFNPAHAGHKMITEFALKRLRLNTIWWLVSTQNPLKSKTDMRPLIDRLDTAQSIANHPKVAVKPIEFQFNTLYTADTIRTLKKRYRQTKFVWIMGADNLAQFTEWKDWNKIATMVSIAVFNRPGYSQKALSSRMARRYPDRRISECKSALLAKLKPPRWVFLHTLLNPISSTQIREENKSNYHG
jgi:nicotinate-nucleotide adenylyltransferase